jgi:hypothetical protein
MLGDPYWEKWPNSAVKCVKRPELELFGAAKSSKPRRFHSFYGFHGVVLYLLLVRVLA